MAPGGPEGPAPETIRLQPTRGFSRVLSPRELWRYRDLAGQIAARDITVRYRQTALGGAWAVLQPIGFMVVFSLFFGNLAGRLLERPALPALQPRRPGPLDLLLHRAAARLRQPRRQRRAGLEDLLPADLHSGRGRRRRASSTSRSRW